MTHQEKVIAGLPKGQRRVWELLQGGGKYSVSDICKATGQCDPRGYIRFLRGKGLPIADEWVRCSEGNFKVYFIKREEVKDGICI